MQIRCILLHLPFLLENAHISLKMCTFPSKCTHFTKIKVSDLASSISKVFLSKDNNALTEKCSFYVGSDDTTVVEDSQKINLCVKEKVLSSRKFRGKLLTTKSHSVLVTIVHDKDILFWQNISCSLSMTVIISHHIKKKQFTVFLITPILL